MTVSFTGFTDFFADPLNGNNLNSGDAGFSSTNATTTTGSTFAGGNMLTGLGVTPTVGQLVFGAGIPNGAIVAAALSGTAFLNLGPLTGNTVSGSPIITGMSSVAGISPGAAIIGAGIPTGATVASVQGNGQITISSPCTATNTGTALTISALCTVTAAGVSITSTSISPAAQITDIGGTYNQGTGTGGNDRYTSLGSPFASVVASLAAGQTVWASFKVTLGTGMADYVAQVLAATNSTLDIASVTTAGFAGTRPANASTEDCRIGGAWAGPNVSYFFPQLTLPSKLVNANGDFLRINIRANAVYNVALGTALSISGYRVEGFLTSPGDGTRFTLLGPTTGTLTNIAVGGNAPGFLLNCVTSQNGNSGGNTAVTLGNLSLAQNIVVHDVINTGISVQGLLVDSEVYNCNQTNAGGGCGIVLVNTAAGLINCYIHDNTGSNTAGVGQANVAVTSLVLRRCILVNNTVGVSQTFGEFIILDLENCDFYGNGIDIAAPNQSVVVCARNCNFCKETQYVLSCTSVVQVQGVARFDTCRFGTGADAAGISISNFTGGNYVTKTVEFINCANYTNPTNPWANAPNGDFRIVSPQAMSAGRGTFTQTASGKAGAIAYPDIGAGQASDIITPVPPTINRPQLVLTGGKKR